MTLKIRPRFPINTFALCHTKDVASLFKSFLFALGKTINMMEVFCCFFHLLYHLLVQKTLLAFMQFALEEQHLISNFSLFSHHRTADLD